MENGIELPYPKVQLCSYFYGTLKFMILERLKRRKMANLINNSTKILSYGSAP
jgi:hypothetical protein